MRETARIAASVLLLALICPASRAAEGTLVRLAADPTLSPDGDRLIFAWHGDLWTVASRGGTAQRLTSHPAVDSAPSFSPDGEAVAFVSNRTGRDQVFVMPAAGGPVRQVTFHSEGSGLQGWYPDGKSLLTRATRDHYWYNSSRLFRVDVEEPSGEELLFNGYADEADVSPDGRRLLFVREGRRWWRKGYRGSRAGQIWLYNLRSEKFEQLIQRETESRTPLWAPDGKGFYYVGGQSGSKNLWYQTLKGKKPRQLTRFDDDAVVMPTVAQDGSTLVFRHLFDLYRLRPGKDEEPKRLRIRASADLDEHETLRRQLDEAEEVAFSADGLEVALIAGGDLWVMDTVLREPRQVTDTPEEERSPCFSPDGKALWFVSDAKKQSDLWKATRGDETEYWWRNDEFQLKRVTRDAAVEDDLRFSPAGDTLAYVRGRGDLWLIDADGKNPRELFHAHSHPDFDWSPDGKWLVYAVSDDDFNRDIWIRPLDGSREPVNLSRHPDNDFAPTWSPDGKAIAFTGQHVGDEIDIYYVYLTREEDETTERDRKLAEALEKFEEVRAEQKDDPSEEEAAKRGKQDPGDETTDKPKNKGKTKRRKEAGKDGGKEDDADEAKQDKPEEEDEPAQVRIDFEDIQQRIRRVSIPDSEEARLLWSPDSKKLAFSATIDGKEGTYTISPPDDLKPKLLSTKRGRDARWIERGDQIVWLVDGVPGSVTASGKATTYGFTASQSVQWPQRYRAALDLCWRTMRDSFYDEALNNRDWDAVRRKYGPMAARATSTRELAEVVHLMLGELNASHLGFSPRSAEPYETPDQWNPLTPHFGLRFVDDYDGPGWKVRDVIPDSPADHAKSKVHAGEILVAVDQVEVGPGVDATRVLNGRLDRDVRLTVEDAQGERREVTLRPISFAAARSLLYDAFVRRTRAAVDEASHGRLGYLHIRAMDMRSFHQFERDLYDAAAGKDGLVIDVRENGGGSTTDHLLTALTQPVHAITVPRGGQPGYPQDRRVYATWDKPIVVLCNQNSFSNAEIFSHAIKTLGRGKLVGVRTAGAVISTGATSIMDLGTLRVPFRGWFLLEDGQDMELNGAVPDYVIWPKPCEIPEGIDRQLDKAVEVLLDEVKQWKKRQQPNLTRASQR